MSTVIKFKSMQLPVLEKKKIIEKNPKIHLLCLSDIGTLLHLIAIMFLKSKTNKRERCECQSLKEINIRTYLGKTVHEDNTQMVSLTSLLNPVVW